MVLGWVVTDMRGGESSLDGESSGDQVVPHKHSPLSHRKGELGKKEKKSNRRGWHSLFVTQAAPITFYNQGPTGSDSPSWRKLLVQGNWKKTKRWREALMPNPSSETGNQEWTGTSQAHDEVTNATKLTGDLKAGP